MARKGNTTHDQYKWDTDKIVYKDKCFECGSNENIDFHHIIPVVLGGLMTIPLCVICHGKVHGKDINKARTLQKIGIEKAKKEGKFKGRKNGAIQKPEVYLNKPKNKKIIELLATNMGIRAIGREVGVSPNTIYKVKIAWENNQIIIDKNLI
jgi:hypothetical protein